jgi:hypothetical protein
LNDPPREPAPLSVDALRAVIRTHALTGPKGRRTRLRMPSDEALAALTATVNHWAATAREAKAEAEWSNIYSEANAAADKLHRLMPAIMARLETEARAAPPGTTFAVVNLDRAQALAAALRHFALPVPAIWRSAGARDRDMPAWRHFMGALLRDLEQAFCQRLALHDTGPAARLLAEIVSHIIGEGVAAATVAEMLRAIKKDADPAG